MNRFHWMLPLFFVLLDGSGLAQARSNEAIQLTVDITDARQKLVHASEVLPVQPGPITLVYPKWIPGEHGPTGPIDDMAGLVIDALGPDGRACGTGAQSHIGWERDKVDMYAFHLVVPQGCSSLTIKMDFLATAAPSGFSASASTTENYCMLSWNTVVLYPAQMDASAVEVSPSLTLPSAWQFATALEHKENEATSGPNYTVAFQRVSLEMLIDSPVLTGKYFKQIELAPEITPKHYLDIVADGPEDLDLLQDRIAEFSRLVREAGALFQSRHYRDYHFLVTLSDSVAHFGLEHHQSSDDRIAAKTFTEDDRFIVAADLLPHEFTHSWNGKYRRPAGLATSNYQKPMVGDLLWVYEGLTQYVGDVLTARAGLWTPEQFRGMLAEKAATMDNWPGRTWRNLQDTTRMAQILYDSGGGWDNWRRDVDFYPEGELIWLDVDTTIRKLTNDKKNLGDFLTAYAGPSGNTEPKVVPYTFDDIVAGLNAVVPHDWASFLRERLDTHSAHAPLGGIENGGYKLVYIRQPNAFSEKSNAISGSLDFWFSLGLRVNGAGLVADVLKGGAADKAGIGPRMHIVAVNGRAFTPQILRSAMTDAQDNGPAIQLILENTGYYRVVTIDYHGGERFPTLQRVESQPDLLDEILQPLVTSK